MKRITLAAMALLAATASWTAPAAAAEEQAGAPADPMMGWKPPRVKNEAKDRKEIMALLHAFDAAGKKGDLDAAVALVDFPVLMATDDSKGQAGGETWTKEKWIEVMRPFYKPMPGMKIEHKPTVFVMSDSLATVGDAYTMTVGKKKFASRSALLLVRTGGEWKVKAMTEGGWGDMMMAKGAEAGAAPQK